MKIITVANCMGDRFSFNNCKIKGTCFPSMRGLLMPGLIDLLNGKIISLDPNPLLDRLPLRIRQRVFERMHIPIIPDALIWSPIADIIGGYHNLTANGGEMMYPVYVGHARKLLGRKSIDIQDTISLLPDLKKATDPISNKILLLYPPDNIRNNIKGISERIQILKKTYAIYHECCNCFSDWHIIEYPPNNNATDKWYHYTKRSIQQTEEMIKDCLGLV